MSALLELPHVVECDVVGCGYNHDGCHAAAVTIGGSGVQASCATFIPLQSKAGLDRVVAKVGACQRSECLFNKDLECSAESVRIGAGFAGNTAGCKTYQAS